MKGELIQLCFSSSELLYVFNSTTCVGPVLVLNIPIVRLNVDDKEGLL